MDRTDHPSSGPTPSGPVAQRGANPVGVASLVVGVLLLLAGVAAQSSAALLPLLMERTGLSYRALPLLISLPGIALALLATVLGVIGLLQRERRRTAAIIGTTLGGSHLLVSIAGVLGSALVVALVR